MHGAFDRFCSRREIPIHSKKISADCNFPVPPRRFRSVLGPTSNPMHIKKVSSGPRVAIVQRRFGAFFASAMMGHQNFLIRIGF